MVVNDISKLRSQRDNIKEYELHKASLGELEAEAKKVKAMIEEMDGKSLKGDSDHSKIIVHLLNLQESSALSRVNAMRLRASLRTSGLSLRLQRQRLPRLSMNRRRL